ncbi:MAG: helix-turn-helix domain-containing protein [Bacteroidetes bacterium]|nr:helix-turn-helix domain-containing protein [Bacteroidota bacterium]
METLLEIKADLKPIKSQEQYQHYLKIIDNLVDCEEDSKEEELLEMVSILVESYENQHFPIESPDPIEAIKLKIVEKGLKRKDLAIYFGSTSRVSEVLNKKRALTFEMAKKLRKGLGISAEVLLS